MRNTVKYRGKREDKRGRMEEGRGKWLKFSKLSLSSTVYSLLPTACFLVLTTSYFLLPISCLYGAGAGSTIGVTMLETVGSRNSALGGAFTSISGDPYSAYSNPAGLADISKRQVSTFFVKGGFDDYKAALIYSQWLLTDLKSGLALGIFNVNGGKMDINYVDGTSNSVVSQSDFLAVLGWGGYTAKNFLVGYTIKYLSTELVEKYKTGGFAFDTGFIAKMGKRFSWGAALQNYGMKIKYNEVKEPLPFLVKSGISLNLPFGISHYFLITADGVYLINEEDLLYMGGIEYSISKKLFLRGGYRRYDKLDFITAGVGLNLSGSLSLDWTTELSDLATKNNVSLGMKF